MKQKKTIDMLIYVATGFTIAHGLLIFLIVNNVKLYENILFHYSESFTWYFIFFLVPLLAGLVFYFWLKNRSISQGLKTLLGALFIFQLIFTVSASIINYNYWGYAFKRPPIFSEVLHAEKVLTCSKVSNMDYSTGLQPLHVVIDTTKSIDNLYGRNDFYYGIPDRIFMAFQDRDHISGHLHNFHEIYNNPELNVSKDILQTIDKQIQESKLVDKGEKSWDTTGQLHGKLTEFLSVDGTTYIFAGLSGGQVANDHYPSYEFLFVKKNQQFELIKKQRFYTDVAGIEGIEYAYIGPLFSFLLTITGLVGAIIIGTINSITKKNRKQIQSGHF